MDDFQSEQEFIEQLDAVKMLTLTRAEALFLSDSMTLLLEHDKDDKSFQTNLFRSGAEIKMSIDGILKALSLDQLEN